MCARFEEDVISCKGNIEGILNLHVEDSLIAIAETSLSMTYNRRTFLGFQLERCNVLQRSFRTAKVGAYTGMVAVDSTNYVPQTAAGPCLTVEPHTMRGKLRAILTRHGERRILYSRVHGRNYFATPILL